jgi:signal transduction histidine kinase
LQTISKMPLPEQYENYRRKQFSELAFWIAGPVASIVTIFACLADWRLYPSLWQTNFIYLRILTVVPSLLAIYLLRNKRVAFPPELSAVLVAGYIVGFHCYFISVTGNEQSEYYNALIQIILASAILPFRPVHFLLLSMTIILAYALTILLSNGIDLSTFLNMRHLPTCLTYLVLIQLLFAILHRLRQSIFLAQSALTDELVLRENKIKELVKNQLATRELTAKAQLAEQVAHDLRSPLGALQVSVSKSNNLEEEIRPLVLSAIRRVTEIADTLLRQYRPNTNSTLDFEPAGELFESLVNEIVEEKRQLFLHRNGLVITLTQRGSMPIPLFVSAMELKRVLSNLIDNAAEAISGSGTISVQFFRTRNVAIISIRDSGVGISKTILSRIFSGVSHGKGRNSGIGLSSAKSILSKLGGRIEIKTTGRPGTTIRLLIPTNK